MQAEHSAAVLREIIARKEKEMKELRGEIASREVANAALQTSLNTALGKARELAESNAVYRRELVEAAIELRQLRGLRDSVDAVGGLKALPAGLPDELVDVGTSLYVVRATGSPLRSASTHPPATGTDRAGDGGGLGRAASLVPGKLVYDHGLNADQLEAHVRLWERVGAELVAENAARTAAVESLEDVVVGLRASLDETLALLEAKLDAADACVQHHPVHPAHSASSPSPHIATQQHRAPVQQQRAPGLDMTLLDEITERMTRTNGELREALRVSQAQTEMLVREKAVLAQRLAELDAALSHQGDRVGDADGKMVIPQVRMSAPTPPPGSAVDVSGPLFECLLSESDSSSRSSESESSSDAGDATRGAPPPVALIQVEDIRMSADGTPRRRRRRFSVSFEGSGPRAKVKEVKRP